MKKNSMKNSRWKSNPIKLLIPFRGIIYLCFILLLSACGEQETRMPENIFLAPTVGDSTPPVIETSTPINFPTQIPTETCENELTFVDDLTVPDGTAFPPGAQIEKIWLVSNDGSCNWDANYSIRHVSGPILGGNTNQGLIPARSGSEVQIRILFEAPTVSGSYQSSWQAYTPSGDAFGDPFFIDFLVDLSLSTTESPAQNDEGTE